MRPGPRGNEAGDLVEMRALSRPFAWIYTAIVAAVLAGMATLYDNDTMLFVFSGWMGFASAVMFMRTPSAIAIHTNGLIVSYLRRDVYYPWADVLELSQDVYNRDSAIFSRSFTLALRGRTLMLSVADGVAIATRVNALRAAR